MPDDPKSSTDVAPAVAQAATAQLPRGARKAFFNQVFFDFAGASDYL